MTTLQRFVDAQDDRASGFHAALEELRAGRKRTHWIWYVFPQLRGLGSSPPAVHFGLDGVAEGRAFLEHALLRTRLIEAVDAAAGQVRAGTPVTTLMGSHIDTLKLVSSMTLFSALAHHRLDDRAIGKDCQQLAKGADTLLDAAASEGVAPCAFTTQALAASVE